VFETKNIIHNIFKKGATCWWFTPIILATQEVEIRTIVRSQPGQIVHETLFQKTPSQNRAGRVHQGVGSEFKPQYYKKNKTKTRQNRKRCEGHTDKYC
jgi:hypothetical protein